MRECGSCTACCEALGVAELQKPVYTACRHQCDGGCGVYADRPQSCRDFECFWRRGLLREGDRPDLLGVILGSTTHPAIGTAPMVIECRPGALESARVQALVDGLLQRSAVVIMTAEGRQVLSLGSGLRSRMPRLQRPVALTVAETETATRNAAATAASVEP